MAAKFTCKRSGIHHLFENYVLWQRWLTIIRDLGDSFLRMTTKLLLQMHLFDKMHEPIYHRLNSQMPSIPSPVTKSDCKPPLGQKKAH